MAKEYFERPSNLLNDSKLEEEVSQSIEIKHFFSGAALYANETMCVTLSPVGLAFKLPGNEANDLIDKDKAIPLNFFDMGHIKNSYALFEIPRLINQATGESTS